MTNCGEIYTTASRLNLSFPIFTSQPPKLGFFFTICPLTPWQMFRIDHIERLKILFLQYWVFFQAVFCLKPIKRCRVDKYKLCLHTTCFPTISLVLSSPSNICQNDARIPKLCPWCPNLCWKKWRRFCTYRCRALIGVMLQSCGSSASLHIRQLLSVNRRIWLRIIINITN